MSGVFRNIDPPTPSPPGECVLPPQRRGENTLAGGGGGGSIVRKTPDTALYFICKFLGVYILLFQPWRISKGEGEFINLKNNKHLLAFRLVYSYIWIQDEGETAQWMQLLWRLRDLAYILLNTTAKVVFAWCLLVLKVPCSASSIQLIIIVFAQGGSPTPHPFSSRPHFVRKFSCQRSTIKPRTSTHNYTDKTSLKLSMWFFSLH